MLAYDDENGNKDICALKPRYLASKQDLLYVSI